MKVRSILSALLIALAIFAAGCGKEAAPAEQISAEVTIEERLPADQALSAYFEILTAAPALDGEHPELEDAAFDDVQNRELFGEHYDSFALTDLNGDGIPELIASSVINFRWVPVSVFTYADGSAVLLKDPMGESANATFEQMSTANGTYTTFICAENHIHSLWHGSTPVGEMTENYAYMLEGTSLKSVECEAEDGTFFSDIANPNTAENAEAIFAK